MKKRTVSLIISIICFSVALVAIGFALAEVTK